MGHQKKTAYFRFFGELNDFLPESKKQVIFPVVFKGNPSVKHLIESAGVPHTEIDLITIRNESMDLSSKVSEGDYVSIYPVFESFDITPLLRIRRNPLRKIDFVVDSNLGKLAIYLRILGFNVLYSNCYMDNVIADISSEQGRILLTRDQKLLHRKQITHGYWVRSTDPRTQLFEIIRRFNLERMIKPFNRCIRCNSILNKVSKKEVLHRIEPKTKKYYNEFKICPECNRIYWKGTHYEKMEEMIGKIREQI